MAEYLSPPEVQHQQLKRGRGYDREAVDHLLESVVVSYEAVWRERDELKDRVAELEHELESLRDSERIVSDALITAQRAGEEIRGEAKLERKQILQEARAKADAVVAGAKRKEQALHVRIQTLEEAEGELQASLRAFLLAGLELVENGPPEAPLGDLPDHLRSQTKKAESTEG